MALLSHPAAGWRIRTYRLEDHVQLESLFLDCLEDFPWRNSAAEEMLRLRRTLSATKVLVTEESSAGIVGFLTLEQANAYVAHLFVHRDWRFCGIGSGLLEVARNMARAPLQLDVDIQNEGAIRAYHAMGWIEKVGATPARGGQRRLSGP